jgi:hypothetical protein
MCIMVQHNVSSSVNYLVVIQILSFQDFSYKHIIIIYLQHKNVMLKIIGVLFLTSQR